jgi:hypothetical protein
MYKLSLAFIIVLFLNSCNTYQQIPLSHQNKPDLITITKVPNLSKDVAWDRAVRLFADHNISIKAIDKSSGFIQSDLLSFVSAYQIDSTVSATNPVYVVTQRENAYDSIIQPSYITGFIKIFILTDSSQTEIHINIESLKSYHLVNIHHRHSSDITHDEIRCEVASTGVLESQIANYISTGNDSINVMPIQNGEILNPKDNYSQYLKKKQRIATGAFIGGYLGGFGILSTILILFLKH